MQHTYTKNVLSKWDALDDFCSQARHTRSLTRGCNGLLVHVLCTEMLCIFCGAVGQRAIS